MLGLLGMTLRGPDWWSVRVHVCPTPLKLAAELNLGARHRLWVHLYRPVNLFSWRWPMFRAVQQVMLKCISYAHRTTLGLATLRLKRQCESDSTLLRLLSCPNMWSNLLLHLVRDAVE